MAERSTRTLDTAVLIVGYAMSRLDRDYLAARGHATWKAAFAEASRLLGIPASSLKNLRDEFDPVHANARRGWTARRMRPTRLRVMGQLCDVSDAALIATVDRILHYDPDALQEVVEPLSRPVERVANVAERLMTGRLAEQYFLDHCESIVGVSRTSLCDCRSLACGYDFGISHRQELAIEIKGLKAARGAILFTDREWSEARLRQGAYWLVVVGNLDTTPASTLIHDPARVLDATCRWQTTMTARWQAVVDLQHPLLP